METKNEIKEITQELVGWENNKIIKTIRDLSVRPGEAIKAYCNEGNQSYLSPIVYFCGVTAVETFIADSIGLFDYMMTQNLDEFKNSLSDPKIAGMFNIDSVTVQLNNYLSFFISEVGQKIVIIPILLLLTWAFYKKFNRSFKQNSWFALFTLGHATLLAIPLMAVWYFTNSLALYSVIGLLFIFVYWVWASKSFYGLKLGKAIVLRLLMTIVAMVAMNMITFGVIIVALASSQR
jgi:hypothetical protein